MMGELDKAMVVQSSKAKGRQNRVMVREGSADAMSEPDGEAQTAYPLWRRLCLRSLP